MAASAVIGALRVNLGLNSASFRGGLDQAQGKLNKWGLSTKATFVAVAAAVAGAAAAIAASVRGSINSADEMSKTAQKFGVPIDTLSRLAYAGKYADVSLETLGKGIAKLSKNMADIAMGSGKDAERAFDALGVSITDTNGKLRSSQDVIYDIADRFAAMPNGVAKTALAIKLFGKSGAELIPLLNSGSAGLREMGEEAERLGFVLDQESGAAAEAFNDKLTRIGAVFEGLSNKLMVAVLPALNYLADRFVEASDVGGSFDGVIGGITVAMNILTRAIGFVFDHLNDLYDLFKIWATARIIIFIGSLAGSMLTLARTVKTAGLAMTIVTSITRAKIIAIILLAAAIAKLTGTYETLVGWVKDFSDTVLGALPEGIKQGIEDLGTAIVDLGTDIETTDSMAADALGGYLQRNEEVIDSFGEVGKSGKGAADDIAEGLDTAGEKAETLVDRMKSAFQSLGQDVKGLIAGTTSWNDVLINVLESLARIGMQQWLASTATAGGGGLAGDLLTSFIGGLFGFASGGSFKVGGSGGVDSQPVAFMASPDEVVSVMTPRQQKEAEENAGGGKSIVVNNTLNIQTPDVRGFKQSEAQISGRLALMTRRGARTL
jgi:hypothetical protein